MQRAPRASFVNSVDSHYLESYIPDLLNSLLSNEHRCIYRDYFDWSKGELLRLGTIYDRAQCVDKLFSHASIPELKMIDKGIIFNAVNNLDRWICTKRVLLYLNNNPEEGPIDFEQRLEVSKIHFNVK